MKTPWCSSFRQPGSRIALLVPLLCIALIIGSTGSAATAPNPLPRPTTYPAAGGSPGVPPPGTPPPTVPPVIRGQPKAISLTTPPSKPLPPKIEVPPPVTNVDRNVTPSPEVLARAAARPKPSKPLPTARVPTLGLPRIDARLAPAGSLPIAANKLEKDPLVVESNAAGLAKQQQGGVNYLAISPKTEWSRPLRGSSRDVTFISLNLNASTATIVEVGGAWLSVLAGEKPGRAHLVIGESNGKNGLSWKKLGYESRIETFGGKEMAVLPILTFRLDPTAGKWDLYCGMRQVAMALPLVSNGAKERPALTVRAGQGGAWLNSVAISDENPLYLDVNANGIDDKFEREHGGLLSPTSSEAQRKTLTTEWTKAQRKRPPGPVDAIRPPPDRFAARMLGGTPQ